MSVLCSFEEHCGPRVWYKSSAFLLDSVKFGTPLCQPMVCFPWYHGREGNMDKLLPLKTTHVTSAHILSNESEALLIQEDIKEAPSFINSTMEEKKIW
jgi:hypothetical protein